MKYYKFTYELIHNNNTVVLDMGAIADHFKVENNKILFYRDLEELDLIVSLPSGSVTLGDIQEI